MLGPAAWDEGVADTWKYASSPHVTTPHPVILGQTVQA